MLIGGPGLLVGLSTLVGLGLFVLALADLVKRPAATWAASGHNQLIWALVVVFVGFFGPLLYLLIARPALQDADRSVAAGDRVQPAVRELDAIQKDGNMNPRSRVSLRVIAAALVTVVAGACGAPDAVDLESLGLAVSADIQAGSTLEIAFPWDTDTTIDVTTAPTGVTAKVSESPDGSSRALSVLVDPDTPRGTYNLTLRVERDGAVTDLGWPFEVVDPVGPAPSTPEALRDEVVAAIAARDADLLRSLWPSASWDTLGTDVIESFTPPSESGACNAVSENRSLCYVFESDYPRVLELTMDLRGEDWMLGSVSLESTN